MPAERRAFGFLEPRSSVPGSAAAGADPAGPADWAAGSASAAARAGPRSRCWRSRSGCCDGFCFWSFMAFLHVRRDRRTGDRCLPNAALGTGVARPAVSCGAEGRTRSTQLPRIFMQSVVHRLPSRPRCL